MPDIMSAVDIAAEFRDELARLDAAAVDVMVGQWRQVETALIADMEAFAARFEPGQSLTPGQVLRLERYQALQAQVTAQLTALEGAAGPLITAGQGQAAQIGALQAATTLDALEVGISFNQLSTKATQNIIALARAGKPLAELLQPMYGAASEGIIRELINGVALGYGPRKIARNMARDGMTDALNHLLLVSRDQYNRAARTAAFQRYEDSGVVRGYTRRCARQAGRTCIACIALDGKFYPLSVPFAEHPQGRCTPIPAIKGVEVRSRLGSGQSWFEGLDEDAQIATMGRGRWEAWKAGELPWDKMAVKTNHPVWGPGVRVAGVPDWFKKAKAGTAVANPDKWKPVMSREEANLWARNSVLKESGWHGTTHQAAEQIRKEGFKVSTNVNIGRSYGHGVYMAYGNNIEDAEFFASGGDLLETVVNVRRVLDVNRQDYIKYLDTRIRPGLSDGRGILPQDISDALESDGYDALLYRKASGDILVIRDPRRITVIE